MYCMIFFIGFLFFIKRWLFLIEKVTKMKKKHSFRNKIVLSINYAKTWKTYQFT